MAIFTTNVDTKHTLQIYEKLSYEALNRHFCQTAVISWPSVSRGCKVLVLFEFRCHCRVAKVSLCVGCGVAVLKILEGKGIFKNNFSFGGKGVSSFAIFGLCVGLCELQMCLHLCNG